MSSRPQIGDIWKCKDGTEEVYLLLEESNVGLNQTIFKNGNWFSCLCLNGGNRDIRFISALSQNWSKVA